MVAAQGIVEHVKYANAAAFRAALEARLNQEAREGGRPIGRAHKFVAFTRLLARLQASGPDAWALKGGFAPSSSVCPAVRARPEMSTSIGGPASMM